MRDFQPIILRSHRSSLSIQVTPAGEVIVKAPYLMPKFLINQFLTSKETWIQEALNKVQSHKKKQKKYAAGETFFYLGKEYTLEFTDTITITVAKENLLFPKALLFRAQKEITNWYSNQAKKIITERVVYHASKMNVVYKDIFFSDTKSKWGTCFHDNTLQFSWRLVMAPLMVLDYVVIHELSHVTHKNHSTAFWARVRQFTPAYRQHRKWLNDHAHLLEV